MKISIEKSIASGFDAHAHSMQRRLNFEEKVLTERFEKVIDLSARLERVMTNLNRIKSDQPVPDGFIKNGEVIPLTEIYEELSIYRIILTEDFYWLFTRKVKLALKKANSLYSNERDDEIELEWSSLNDKLRSIMDRDFGLNKIR